MRKCTQRKDDEVRGQFISLVPLCGLPQAAVCSQGHFSSLGVLSPTILFFLILAEAPSDPLKPRDGVNFIATISE